jgi:hydroxymethylpyrimidine/phosphomethylpyrimidine kinase
VQDTSGVESLHAMDAEHVRAQAELLLAETRVAAFKLGVLGSAANIHAVAAILEDHPGVPVVVDPVLASGRGDPLASEDAIWALLPRATIATPNMPEANRLGGHERMIERGCRFVLVTGTHDEAPEVVNRLYDARGLVREDRWPRLPGSYHGSGCTLASAIAAALAKGSDVPDAVREAQEFTWRSLQAAFASGKGQSTPNRFFQR